jgi:hypothetical protein
VYEEWERGLGRMINEEGSHCLVVSNGWDFGEEVSEVLFAGAPDHREFTESDTVAVTA